MSSELIVIIIGVLFILLALGDSVKSLQLVNSRLRVPLGVVGVLLLIYTGFSYDAINLTGRIEQPAVQKKVEVEYPVRNVQVISPIQGDSVDCRILTMGVYPDGHEKDIWVVLKPSDNKFYPQSDHTNTSYKRNGQWQVIARFGGDKGEEFEVIVYETDTYSSNYFSETIAAWKEANEYPGLQLNELPDGAVEVDRMTVFMKDNCRGVF